VYLTSGRRGRATVRLYEGQVCVVRGTLYELRAVVAVWKCCVGVAGVRGEVDLDVGAGVGLEVGGVVELAGAV
jgi:hypothetical protein